MFNHQVLALVLILLFIVSPIASAQTSTATQGQAQETPGRGYWIDPATKLMWAGKDNGKDADWGQAAGVDLNLVSLGPRDPACGGQEHHNHRDSNEQTKLQIALQ